MSFLFKSKKEKGLPPASRNTPSADSTNVLPGTASFSQPKNADLSRFGPPPPAGVVDPAVPRGGGYSPTPEQATRKHRADSDSTNQGQYRPAPGQKPPTDMSLYPWSQRSLQFNPPQANPFPRYGAALNSVAGREGDIYMMGGLINGTTVKGDLWMIEAGSGTFACYPVQTTSDGPGPRVGHASLLVGNAFIVFGGDTKLDEGDVLDDTLYLLNTSTKNWSRANPLGARPAGRYGHTLNILGSRIYVFGGQVEGFFFNDLCAFDLNSLQSSSNRWEVLIQNSNDGGPPTGQSPPARTNHTIITWDEKLYLFGGTDGVRWFNDVWAYDPRINSWAPQECIGFIPTAREGHAAALVGDVMYVFGGRTEEGKDLGDLAAFRLPTRRWYTFQNMGPSPSPRSGHGMTAFGNLIVVLGGEPSSPPRDPPRDPAELCTTYLLDTAKIRYPNDSGPAPSGQRVGGRRPSLDGRGTPQSQRSSSRDGATSETGGRLRKSSSQDSNLGQSGYANGVTPRPARGPAPPTAPGPPPQQQAPQPQINGSRGIVAASQGPEPQRNMSKLDKVLGPEHPGSSDARQTYTTRDAMAPEAYSQPREASTFDASTPSQPTQTAAAVATPAAAVAAVVAAESTVPGRQTSQRSQREQGSVDSSSRGIVTSATEQQWRPTPIAEDVTPPTTQTTKQQVDSGVGSSPAFGQQNDDSSKEIETLKSRNAWYASELALAQKAGYRASTLESPTSDERAAEAFGDDEKPLLEALVKMRSELAKVQESLDKQTSTAAGKIAQVEKQRDAAIAEAVYAKTRYAARGWKGGSTGQVEESRDTDTPDNERAAEASRRLAASLEAQNDMATRLKAVQTELESEKRARQLAEESAEVAQNRASELDKDKQQRSSELETIRTELYEAQKLSREHSANYNEAIATSRSLQLDKDELSKKYSRAQTDAQSHGDVLVTLREAVESTTAKANAFEKKLQQEQRWTSNLREKMQQLKTDYEARTTELEHVNQRLRDSEELAETHAAEAKTHREAVLAGLGNSREKRQSDDFAMHDERVSILNQQLESANALVRQNQEAADQASERLRRAEERIAGLEAYQEQTSREGLSLRKQLQGASKEVLSLQSSNTELQQSLSEAKMDSTSLQVQHSALKDLLNERGIDTSELPKTASGSLPNSERIRDLEQQLEVSKKSHEDMRGHYEQREEQEKRNWEEKLAALDANYQSAVNYLKKTEKMVGKMKQELYRYKSQNKELEDELSASRTRETAAVSGPSSWESERAGLQKRLEDLQREVQESTGKLNAQMQEVRESQAERDSYRESSLRYQQELASATQQNRADVEDLRAQNSLLESRADEAERKVQALLDQVGQRVSNYRRQSQLQQQQSGTANGAVGGISMHDRLRGLSTESAGYESNYSASGGNASADEADDTIHGGGGGGAGGELSRNSIALDSLASELETLRSHWETTNKNYNRFSDRSDLEVKAGSTSDFDIEEDVRRSVPGGFDVRS